MFDSIIHDYRNLTVNQKTLLKKIIKIISIIGFYMFLLFVTMTVFLWKMAVASRDFLQDIQLQH